MVHDEWSCLMEWRWIQIEIELWLLSIKCSMNTRFACCTKNYILKVLQYRLFCWGNYKENFHENMYWNNKTSPTFLESWQTNQLTDRKPKNILTWGYIVGGQYTTKFKVQLQQFVQFPRKTVHYLLWQWQKYLEFNKGENTE